MNLCIKVDELIFIKQLIKEQTPKEKDEHNLIEQSSEIQVERMI